MTIGELIHNRRKELKLTLEEVGNAVGVSKSTVRKWETGYISNMKRDKIALLAKTLNLSPAQFIVESNEEIVQNKPNYELINIRRIFKCIVNIIHTRKNTLSSVFIYKKLTQTKIIFLFEFVL